MKQAEHQPANLFHHSNPITEINSIHYDCQNHAIIITITATTDYFWVCVFKQIFMQDCKHRLCIAEAH